MSDNDAARAGLIKLVSDVPQIRRIPLHLARSLEETPCFPWYSRVPSPSNVADSVSRLEKLPACMGHAEEVFLDCEELFTNGQQEEKLAQMRKPLGTRRRGGAGPER